MMSAIPLVRDNSPMGAASIKKDEYFDDTQTLKSFVAGQTIMERNPMSVPLSMVGNSQYNMHP